MNESNSDNVPPLFLHLNKSIEKITYRLGGGGGGGGVMSMKFLKIFIRGRIG